MEKKCLGWVDKYHDDNDPELRYHLVEVSCRQHCHEGEGCTGGSIYVPDGERFELHVGCFGELLSAYDNGRFILPSVENAGLYVIEDIHADHAIYLVFGNEKERVNNVK